MKWAVIGLVAIVLQAVALFFLLRWMDGRTRRASARRTQAEVDSERDQVVSDQESLSDQEAMEQWKNNTTGVSQ